MTLSPELMTMLLQLDRDGISECYDVLKHHRASLDRKAKNSFSEGDLVTFDYKGKTIEGKIEKINRSRIIVRPLNGGRGWKVYPSSPKPLITKDDMTKLNDAIDEAAKQIVANNEAKEENIVAFKGVVFDPMTGEFE